MKDQFLENNKDVLLSILNLSGIKNIKLENIKSIELGGRSFCFLCKNTEKGNLFIKIDMDLDAFSFIETYRETEMLRKERVNEIIIDYSNVCDNVPKIFNIFKIPTFIDDLKMPNYLIGKTISFSEFVSGHSLNPKFEITTNYQRFCMKYYSLKNIENMLYEVSKFHSFCNKNKYLDNVNPFFQLLIEDYKTLKEKLDKININIEPIFCDNFFINIKKEIEVIFLEFEHNMGSNKIDEDLVEVKLKYFTYLKTLYKNLVNFNLENIDLSLYNNSSIISLDDFNIGKKIIYLESLINIYTQKNVLLDIIKTLNEIKDIIPELMSLPEAITHNDVHPLNFIESETKKLYLIDFDRCGKNKRICDIGLTLITNNPDREVIYSMINGYRKYNSLTFKDLTPQEMKHVYNFYILCYLTSFVRQLTELNLKNIKNIKHVINPNKVFTKIKEFKELSNNNILPEILKDIIQTNLDGLNLECDHRIKNKIPKTFREKLIKEREELKPKFKEI